MIRSVVETGHQVIAGERPEALDGLLAEDVVFYSPIAYAAARQGCYDDVPSYGRPDVGRRPYPRRVWVPKQVLAGDVAMLEFETTICGKYVNGVDVIRCDDTGHVANSG